MLQSELAYLERRAAVEAELAQQATCPAAVRAHYEMSKAYFESAAALKQLDRTDGTSAG
jgi:anti-sigma factor RsiW